MVELLNTIARLWWEWTAAMFWQVGLLILLIAGIDLLIRKWAWPQLRYTLWSLILVKLLLPPTLSLPGAIVPELRPRVAQALRRLNSEKTAASENSAMILNLGSQISDFDLGAARPSRSTGVPPVSSMGVSPMSPWEIDGQDARGTHGRDGRATGTPNAINRVWGPIHGQDAHATKAPPGVTTNALEAAALPVIPAPDPGPPLHWQVHAMLLWLSGTLILGIWLFLRLHSVAGRHASRAAAASLPPSFYNHLAGCAARLGLRRIPRVAVTHRLTSPAVFGVLSPVLLMPKGYLRKLSRRDTEHMLLHELAHIKRGDLVMHGLYLLLQIVYWYNPLLWLVRRQVHHLRELSCDGTVAELLRERTAAYRQTLLETARRLLATSAEPGLGLLGLFEDSNRLLVRLHWLTKPTWRYKTMKRVTVATIAALMLACVLPMAQARESASQERRPPVVREEDQAAQEQLSQDIATLQARLEELMSQQRQLQEQLRALSEKREQVQEQARRARDQAERATKEAARAQREALRGQVEAERGRSQEGPQSVRRMPAWGEQLERWGRSEEMQKWQRDMEQWGRQMERWGQDLARRYTEADGSEAPDAAPRPAMPPMPPMPALPRVPAETVVPPAAPHARPHTGDREVPQVTVPRIHPPHVEAPRIELPRIDPPVPPAPPAIPERREDQQEAVSRTEHDLDLAPGRLLDVKNEMGSIAIRGGAGPGGRLIVTVKGRAATMEEAQAIVDQVKPVIKPSQDGVSVTMTKPEKENREHFNRVVTMELVVPRDARLRLSQNLGDIRLTGLDGSIRAVSNMGSIRATEVRGRINLESNMGSIDFIAPNDLSAKVQAKSQMGSIQSDLPLEFVKPDAFSMGSRAAGTIGGGEGEVSLTTNMGSIRIRRESAEPVRVEPSRRESRPQPRPEPPES